MLEYSNNSNVRNNEEQLVAPPNLKMITKTCLTKKSSFEVFFILFSELHQGTEATIIRYLNLASS